MSPALVTLHRHPIEAGVSRQVGFGRFAVRGEVLAIFDPITRSTVSAAVGAPLPPDRTSFVGGISPRVEGTFELGAALRVFAGGGADLCFDTIGYAYGVGRPSTSTWPVRPRLDAGLFLGL